jgi:hypothetical protein
MITASKLAISSSRSIKDQALGMFRLLGLKEYKILKLSDVLSNGPGIFCPSVYL